MSLFVGIWGAPLFSSAVFVGILVATITAILESIGDYYTAARVCKVRAPPAHAINRGVAVEGLGSIVCGLIGAAHATTSYSPPTALIRLTGVCAYHNVVTLHKCVRRDVCCAKQLKRCVHELSTLQKVDLRKSPLKLWTCERLKFN